MSAVHICSFSGDLSDLKPKERTDEHALSVLARSPRVSVWDMGADWLCTLVQSMERRGLIIDDRKEPYPWIRYALTDKGREVLSAAGRGVR